MKIFHNLDTKVRRNLLVLFTAGLLFWSSLASLLPTLPLYIEDIGATKQQLGFVMGSFAIGLLLFRSFLGRLADTRGRKIVLLIGTVVCAIAPFGYIAIKSIPLLLVLRAFHGISLAAFTTGYLALVADIAPTQNRGEVIGYMSLVNPIGLAIGPAIGGYLQSTVGYTPLFLTSAGLGCLATLCVLPIVNPAIDVGSALKNDNSIWQMLVSPRVRIPAMIMLIVGLAFGTLHTFVPLFIKSTKVDLNPGLFYTAAAIASFSIRLFSGRLSDRYGRGLFITISLIFYTLAMIMLWQAHSAQDFLLAAIIEGGASGILIPMISTMMADRAYPQERGRVFSVCIMGLDVGIALAGPILGSLAEPIGYANMFAFAAGLTGLGLIIFLTLSGKDLPNSVRFALGRTQDAYAVNKLGVRS
ncbi:MAG: MFS transporter [Cyanomargarita calcarea GSE-NOS-MK-12-04C]|uniref:MFS transporter n=1 Tax=Cyanomargarita calcarea GSE-NOS-MK-12-04C TaxID=2839659 RepID=A0A951UU00_9CYAN|nr:MFS transporter [Cyanomargarita calcarea GSE-NOS-MK-12-04C]